VIVNSFNSEAVTNRITIVRRRGRYYDITIVWPNGLVVSALGIRTRGPGSRHDFIG